MDIQLTLPRIHISRTFVLSVASLFAVGIFISGLSFVVADDTAARRAELEVQLAEEQAVYEELERQKNALERESVSYERDLEILNYQINQAGAVIRSLNLGIEELNIDIDKKTEVIGFLSNKLSKQKRSLGQLIKKTDELDDFSLVEVMLSNKNLSEFFIDLDSFDAIEKSLNESFREIEDTKTYTQEQKRALESTLDEQIELRNLELFEKSQIDEKQQEKAGMLSMKEDEIKSYESTMKEKERTIAEIKAALFSLRDSTDISFGQAVEYAKIASAKTGVRAALVLAILKRESDMGKNVGTCNRPGDSLDWDEIMPGPIHYRNYIANGSSCIGAASPCSWRDDQGTFLDITSRLGIDHESIPLSCPAGASLWGGAMGPAQFIPTTWSLLEDRIGQLTGNNPPSPWDPYDAFVASAMLLKDNGATKSSSTCTQTTSSEKCAALRYFAGWGQPYSLGELSYGNYVMEWAAEYQAQIDILDGE
jgi:peptidoglycan hydrolase CwlO-like protein